MQLRVNKNFFHQSIFYLSNIVQQCRGNIGREVIGLLPSTYRPTTGSGHAEGRPTQCGQSYYKGATMGVMVAFSDRPIVFIYQEKRNCFQLVYSTISHS